MANKRREDELQEDRASYGGSSFDQKYFSDDELRGAAEARAAAERGDTDWGSAHDYVEGIRAKYGYTGGQDGSQYQRLGQAGAVDYYSLPQRTTQYGEQINALMQRYMNRAPFSYNAEEDPLYQQYAKSYGENGRRAMQDTLAQISARTGGLASSYAGTASQQAYDRYMQQLSDKVPELYKLAHDMYLSEGDQMRDDISLLRGLDSDEYGRTVDDWNRRYQLGRDAVSDARYADELGYSRGRDAISDARYADETAYAREQDAIAQRSSALSTIMGMIQSGMTLDSVPSYLLDQAGLTGDQYGSMSRDAAAQLAAQAAMSARSSSGGSSRRSSSGSSKTTAPKAKDDPMGYLDYIGAESMEDALYALRAQGVNKDSAEYYARKYFGDMMESRRDDDSLRREGEAIAAYTNQGMYANAASRINYIWDSLSEDQQQTLMDNISKWPQSQQDALMEELRKYGFE